MTSPSQDTVACTCPSCGNPFAVQKSSLGRQVKCPICFAPVTAVQNTAVPEAASGREEKRPRPSAPPLQTLPQKKTDKRAIFVPRNTSPSPEANTTKIRKRREQKEEASSIPTAGNASLAEEMPAYDPPPLEAERMEQRPTWHIWLFIISLVLVSLGTFMYLRGSDLEAENSKILNISDRFVDHEADFSAEVNKDLLKELQQRAKQYQLIAHTRKKEDQEAENVSAHITAAMNELALYCMAESDEERLNYVMDPAATRPKMAHWTGYGQYKDYLPQEPGRSSKHGDLLQISVLMDDNTQRPAIFLYDHDSKKWKLDWEAWEGYSPLTPQELISKKPSSPVPVRAIISMPGIYQAPFLEEATPESYRNTAYINFSLEFPNGERVNAYVDRYSPLALELTKLLYNGSVRACVLIHYPADLPGNKAVIIDQLLYSGWMSDATRKLLPGTH